MFLPLRPPHRAKLQNDATPRQSPKSQVTRIPHAALVKGSHIYRGLLGKNGKEILAALSFELDPYKDER
jgi:hypothetical protein